MWKIILISIVSLLIGCADVPVLERPVTLWNGAPDAPEGASICRLKAKDLQYLSGFRNVPRSLMKQLFANDDETVCLPTNIDYFKEFGCMTFDDFAVVQRYIETLIHEIRDCK